MQTRRGSGTKIGKKMTDMAYWEYRTKFETCRKMLKGLEAALNHHKQDQISDPLNWGWNGDLGRVEELLEDAISALSNGNR